MLTLLLLRHAKSSWDDASMSDHDRPLSDRGERAAPLIGAYIARHDLAPELVLCSTAQRTRLTLERIRRRIGSIPEIAYEKELYLAEADQLLKRLQAVPRGPRRVMMIGHNPGFEDFARMLSGDGDSKALASLAEKFPTAGLAVITFEGKSWSAVAPGLGTLARFITPRSLEKASS